MKPEKRIELLRGDITRVEADAIVNAANPSLLGGGGVDGAIHRAAGPELLEYCRKCGGARPGEAKISPGFRLPARYVIHAVGPVWQGGGKGEAETLRCAYLSSLQLAEKYQLESVAFPNISTGVYGFPKDLAADIAIRTVKEWLAGHEYPKKVMFVVFDKENEKIYREKLGMEPQSV